MDMSVLPLPHPVDESDLPPEVVGVTADKEVAVQEDVQELGCVFLRRTGLGGKRGGRGAGTDRYEEKEGYYGR